MAVSHTEDGGVTGRHDASVPRLLCPPKLEFRHAPSSCSTHSNAFSISRSTFLCAMHPTMREDWAKAWHGHLSPGGKLITLIFPINPAADPGPPWYIHADMCKELLIPAGFELETLEKVPDELSLKGREGMEMTAVWRRI
ncbi:hypothetical protein ACKKBG_A31170 [Auxenochlorella protothecoides x Auxenochlorella symbiontica]